MHYGVPEEVLVDDNKLKKYADAEDKENMFYDIRDDDQKRDPESWAKMNPIYQGVPAMLEELKSEDVNTVILSSKDEDSIRMILKYNRLEDFVNPCIIDKEKGHRPEQFKKFQEEFPGYNFAYDDLIENLEHAKEAGIRPILAPQGYETEDKINLAGKRGIVIAEPYDVPEIISILKEEMV